MDEILLITYKNNIYRDELHSKGYNITEFAQPLSDEKITEIEEIHSKGIVLIEIIDENLDRINRVIEILNRNSALIITISNNLTDKSKKFLIEHGISDLIESADFKRIINYIEILKLNKKIDSGKILILDDVLPRINIIKTIITRFNYTPIIINSIDKLFESLQVSKLQFIMVNLGTEGFDINDFSRRSYQSNDLKKFPVIPFKDMKEGLFIHEMLSKLNRIASIILSSDEVYSFLVDILFRKELLPFIDKLDKSVDHDKLELFSEENLRRIYYSLGTDIFSMKNILHQDNYNRINGFIDSIKDSLVKVDGLRWLKMK